MESISVLERNATYVKIEADPGIMMELSEHFTFDVPGAKFMPLFKNKRWDGKLRLLSPYRGFLYAGLVNEIYKFAESRGYAINDHRQRNISARQESEIDAFLRDIPLTSREVSISAHDYQRAALIYAINNPRTILISPTGSGKSLILYLLVRWQQAQGMRRQLIVVPTTSLVEQMYKDFADYSSTDSFWSIEKQAAMIYSGKEKNIEMPLIISTWQSLFRLPEKFFQEFDVIYGDECHVFSAKSLKHIMESATKTHIRIGTTGTLDGTKTHQMVLEGLFGPIHNVTTSRKLMDDSRLAEIDVRCIILEYSNDDKQAARKKKKYEDEIEFLLTHPKRNRFIRNLALRQTNNTLVLFRYREHGNILFNMVQEKNEDEKRKVFFVDGLTNVLVRENIRGLTEDASNAIIIASMGVFSTGIDIRNLNTIIFANPLKSRIRHLQSLGRGSRRTEGKSSFRVFDIGDDLGTKTRPNVTLKHLMERVSIYNAEEFPYTIVRVPL